MRPEMRAFCASQRVKLLKNIYPLNFSVNLSNIHVLLDDVFLF